MEEPCYPVCNSSNHIRVSSIEESLKKETRKEKRRNLKEKKRRERWEEHMILLGYYEIALIFPLENYVI